MECGPCGGFNLVELLVAMVVLSIVVTMMASIFRDSQSASTQGTAATEIEAAGRNALSMMTRDLQGAVGDTNLVFKEDRSGVVSYGFTNSEVLFITLDATPTHTSRAARAVMYSVQPMTNSALTSRYELVRACYSTDNCYTDPGWFTNAPMTSYGVVAENVSALLLAVPEDSYFSDEHSNTLPAFVDICLELLNERDARQAADLWVRDLDYTNFVERTARRFTTRVFFNNRNGYRGDKPR